MPPRTNQRGSLSIAHARSPPLEGSWYAVGRTVASAGQPRTQRVDRTTVSAACHATRVDV